MSKARAPARGKRPAKDAEDPRPRKQKTATRDAAATASRILKAGRAEFAERGYEGARIERIVADAAVNMRMLYHYYGNKQGLYLAVLESVYEEIRDKESQLKLDHLEPVEGIAALIDFTFSHFAQNSEFVQITLNENLQRGIHIAQSARIPEMSSSLIGQIRELLRRGGAAGLMRPRVDPLQLYISIVALCGHHVNNAHTLTASFGTDLTSDAWRAKRRQHVRDIILSYLTDPRAA